MLLNSVTLKKLQLSGLKSISISLESVNPKMYESIRLKAKYSQLIKTLKLLQKQTSIQTFLNIVLFKDSFGSYPKIKRFIDFASKYNIKNLNFFISDNVIESKTLNLFTKNRQKYQSIYQRLQTYASKKSISINLPSIGSSGNCTSPWLFPFITVSGDVLPCCAILHLCLADGLKREEIIKKYSFGNILDNNISTIWNSQSAIKFRQNFVNKQHNPYCLRCSKYYGFK
jgi:MoaA/NifB/PqqE/SkfB family radical SAM enzyme